MTAPVLSDVVAALDALYPPAWADAGDPVGLAVGDPDQPVERVLFAVDPVQAVVDEAQAYGAGLVVTHHPLLFRGVHTVAATTPKGRVVHALVRQGIGLYTAHTNADHAPNGVSRAIADALGLVDVRPLVPAAADPLDKLVTFVPASAADQVLEALAAAGAGGIGDYDRCAFTSLGQGTFRPGPAAHPTIGTPGHIEVVAEQRLEMVLPRARRAGVVEALRQAHPYEEPAFDVFELAGWPADRGIGCVGRLAEPESLSRFAQRVVDVLPPTASGARVSGDLDAPVRTVALVGGAGDAFLADALDAGADVYLTSDLRHHPASEFREQPSAPALVDVPHWAAEWCWLAVAEAALRGALAPAGRSIETRVSRVPTDPWNHHVSARRSDRGGPP